jgi:hypothetical protein
MKKLFYDFNFFLFLLENRLYYPEVFKVNFVVKLICKIYLFLKKLPLSPYFPFFLCLFLIFVIPLILVNIDYYIYNENLTLEG